MDNSNIARLISACALALITMGSEARAHHSFSAEFEASRPFKITGIVTKVEWMNPHIFFYVDVVEDETRKVTNWTMELGSPNNLMRNGWTRNSLKIGDVITVEGSQARDARPMGSPTAIIVTKTGQRLLAGVNESQP